MNLKNINIIIYTSLINGSSINIVTRKIDLGILFCSNIDFHYHIEVVCCRAFKILGFVIHMTKEFKLSTFIKTLYSLVRPLLQYSSIERIQRCFSSSASFILQIPHSLYDYRPVMNKLGLLSLADRKVEANLVFFHKLIDGHVDASFL